MFLKLSRSRFPKKLRQAFSLVEITLAIGILSFCMIPIMGLIPVALNTSRKAMEKNIETRILQNVRAELLQIPFSELPEEGVFVFDADGYRLDGSAASGPREIL